MSNSLNIQKLAPTLTGTEKARLIVKNFYEKLHGNKIGFLTDADMVALLKIKDTQKDEFKRYVKIYSSVPDIIMRLLDIQTCFIITYQELKVAHFRLLISKGLHDVNTVITNSIMKRILTKDEYRKMEEDALNKTVSVKELVDIETALALIQQGRTRRLEIDPYEAFDLDKVPFRCNDPERDAVLKEMFVAERAIQESKINEAIASGNLKAEGDRIRIDDWQKYSDKLDTALTTRLYDAWLVLEGSSDDDLAKMEQGEVGLKRLLKGVVNVLDEIQPIGIESEGLLTPEKVIIKNMDATREIISELHLYACEIFTLTNVATKIAERLGFDPLAIAERGITHQTIMDNIMDCISKHNNTVLRYLPRDNFKGMEALILKGIEEEYIKEPINLSEYLIPDPVVNEVLYNEWHKKIFEARI